MGKNVKNLFKALKNAEPPAGLEGEILKNIASRRKWQVQRRLILADALMLGSAGAFVFSLINLWEGISKAAFWSLAKLAFSDTSAVFSFWKDFLYSLLETFPAGHLAAVLAPILLFMVSFHIYFSNGNHGRHKNYKF